MDWNDEYDGDSEQDDLKQRNFNRVRKQFRKVHNGQRNRKERIDRNAEEFSS